MGTGDLTNGEHHTLVGAFDGALHHGAVGIAAGGIGMLVGLCGLVGTWKQSTKLLLIFFFANLLEAIVVLGFLIVCITWHMFMSSWMSSVDPWMNMKRLRVRLLLKT